MITTFKAEITYHKKNWNTKYTKYLLTLLTPSWLAVSLLSKPTQINISVNLIVLQQANYFLKSKILLFLCLIILPAETYIRVLNSALWNRRMLSISVLIHCNVHSIPQCKGKGDSRKGILRQTGEMRLFLSSSSFPQQIASWAHLPTHCRVWKSF